MTSFNEVPLTDEQAVSSSSLIIRGTIDSVLDGRTIDYLEGPSHPIHTAVLKVLVSTVAKGRVGDYAYVEYIRGGIDPADLNRVKYEGELLMLLHEADDWNPEVHRFDDDGKGVATGETLYTLRTQSGLFLQAGTTIERPLAPDDPPSNHATTLDELEADMMVPED
jgi:hypothetical protein